MHNLKKRETNKHIKIIIFVALLFIILVMNIQPSPISSKQGPEEVQL